MKLLTSLTVAALLTGGAAFAASTPSTAPATTATPAATATPATKHNSAMHCERVAKEKKLTGEEAKTFVKECREGKK